MTNPESDNDECLTKAILGDQAARAQLLEKHRDRLKRMVSLRIDRRLMKRIDPSDIIQETLVLANHRLDSYLRERPIPFYPWLRQMAWEQLVMAMRKHVYAGRRSQNREVVLPDLSDESVAELATRLFDYSADPLKKLLRAEANARLIETLNQLPEQDREILVLRYLEQLSTTDTAAVLKISQSAAKMRHLRALQRLRVLLDNQSMESSE